METDQTELKHRNNKTDSKKTAIKESESESESDQLKDNNKNDISATTTSISTATAAAAAMTTNVPTVIRTKEEYFDALRVWLQQVQLQQMAYTYFPYYLSANLPPNMNNVLNASMPFPTTPPQPPIAAAAQFPAFPPAPMGINQPGGIGFNFANAVNAGNAGDALNRAPFIGNSIFQNRNQYMENMRQNMQILYQNGGYEYIIAPIWKRVLAEAIDVRLQNEKKEPTK